MGAWTKGRLSSGARRHCHHIDPIPRIRGHVHGALPQYDARRQRDAPPLRGRTRIHPDGYPESHAAGGQIYRNGSAAGSVHEMIRRASQMMIPMLLGCARLCTAASWGSHYFPNVPLTTQEGKTVRFYDDL